MADKNATQPAEAPAKTEAELAAEAKALLDSFTEKASGPSAAEQVRQIRLSDLANLVANAAAGVNELVTGTANQEKVVEALKSLKTAKDRATAAIKAIPDEVLVSTVPLASTEDDELAEAGL